MSSKPKLKSVPPKGNGKPHPELIEKKNKAKVIEEVKTLYQNILVSLADVNVKQDGIRNKLKKLKVDEASYLAQLAVFDEVVNNHVRDLGNTEIRMQDLGIITKQVEDFEEEAVANLDEPKEEAAE